MQQTIDSDLELMNGLMDSIHEGIVVVDSDLRIKKVNKWIASKISANNIVGTYCYKTLRNTDKPCEGCPVLKTFATGKSIKEILSNPLNENEDKLYEVTSSPILGKTGAVELVLENYNDITHLKTDEVELIERGEKYKALYDNAPLAYQLLNIEGVIIDVNPAWLKLLGYTREEVLGKWFVGFLHPDFVPHFKKNFLVLEKQGQINNVQFRMIKKDHSEIYVSFEGCIGYYPDGTFKQTYGTLIDITEEVKSKNELILAKEKAEESEKKLIEAQKLSHIGSWEYIIESDIVSWSKELYNIFERSYDLPAPKYSEQQPFYTKESFEILDKAVQDCLQNENPYEIVLDIITSSGSVKQIISKGKVKKDENKKIIGLYGTAQDITERKKIEKKISDTQFYLSKAQELGKIGTWELDIQKNNLTWTDENYRIFGVELGSTLTYERFLSCVHPEDRDFVKKEWASKMMTNNYDIEHRLLVDGKIKWVREKAEISFNKKGEPVTAIGFTQDITERKQAEENIRTAEEKMKSTFDLSPSIISQANIDTGYFIEANPAVTRILGYTIEEFKATPIFDLLHPDDRQRTADEIAAQLKGKEVTFFENRYLCKDGRYKWIAWHGTKADKNGIVTAIGSDVTEKKMVDIERIKAKEKAEENETRFKELFESVSDAIFIYHPETYEILEANEATSLLYGYSYDELIGMSCLKFSAELDKSLEVAKLVKNQRKVSVKFRHHKKKDGTDIFVELNTYNIKTNKRSIFYTICHDITNIKQAEFELIKAKEVAELNASKINEQKVLFETMLNTINEGIVVTNVNREIVLANKGMLTTFGYKPEELIGKPTKILYANPEKFNEAGEKVFNKEAVSSDNQYLTLYRHKNNTVFPGETFGAKLYNDKKEWIGNIGIMRDVSERERFISDLQFAKEKAEESEAKFKLLNQLTSEMLLLMDLKSMYKFIVDNLQKHLPNTIVLYVSINESSQQTRLEVLSGLDNNLFNKVIKISRFNPIGREYKLKDLHNDYFKSGNFVEFKAGLAEFSSSEVNATIASSLEKIIGLHKIYTIGINKDDELFGAIHFLTFNKQVITDGSFIEVFARQAGLVLQKKINEKALIHAKESAEKANRLKTEFLNNMSHEVRTPMNGIIGFSEMLDKSDITEEKRKYYSRIVQNSSHQLLKIIDDILDISNLETKQEKINEDAFCLNDALMELFSIFNLKSKIRKIPMYLKKALHDNQSLIVSDKTKLIKILSNLLENAIKFTNEGFIEFGYFIETTKLVIYVKDTGIGISPENKEIIFERFSQEDKETSRLYGGLGLGLSISKENAQLLGGDITIESEKGKGSTFYVTIPYKPAQISKNNIFKSSKSIQKTDDHYTILIAEDEEVNYLYLEALFEEENEGNYKLVHAKNGKEAVEICIENTNIDLVLMDIKMPVMNGLEATKKIKSNFPDLPIIAQTAYSTETDKQLALESGCDDFIVKPINKEKLFEMTNKYLKVK